MTPEAALKALNKAIDGYTDRYITSLDSSSRDLFKRASQQINQLEGQGGNLRGDTATITAVNRIVADLERGLRSGPYGQATQRYLSGFGEVTAKTGNYFETVKLNYQPTAFANEFSLQRIAEVESTLLGAGLTQGVLAPIKNILLTNLQSRATIEELREALRQQIIPSGASTLLTRHAATYADTALATYNASYLQEASQALGIEYYRYDGSVIKSTRPFCRNFVNQYFSKKEIERMGEGQQPYGGGSLTQAELEGRIAGTNAQTILTLRGGWNCRHRFIPTPKTQVPKAVLERNGDKLEG
jgi:hypothetical protein